MAEATLDDGRQVTLDWTPPTLERRAANRPWTVARQTEIRVNRPLRSIAWRRRYWLDQLKEGACVGFGAAHVRSAGRTPRPVSNELARQWYRGSQRHDQWLGESYEGSSVLGASNYLRKEAGEIEATLWAETLDEVLHAVVNYDPVEFGCNWHQGMLKTDSDGYIRPEGEIVGGHAFAIGAVDTKRQDVTIWQSWGPSWGVNGAARLKWSHLEQLLHADGECALFRPRRPVTP